MYTDIHVKCLLFWSDIKKGKWSRQRPGRDRGIALLFHDRGTRRGWVVSSTPRPHFNPRKDPVPILQVAGWAPGPVWTGGKSRPQRDSIPDRPARSQSLYRMSYRTHLSDINETIFVQRFSKSWTSNFMKIRPVDVYMFHADGRKERRTTMIMLIDVARNFATKTDNKNESRLNKNYSILTIHVK